jgi:hypothetical protein
MSVISTQGFTFRMMAGDPPTQLDLFQDEDYILSNNVTGLFDIGLLPSDFTRQITIPGTKVNDAFFEHCYDISIDSPFLFATNQKVPAYFEFDSVYLSNGYLQLNKVNVLANKFIDSYEVTIYGTLSSFGRDINRLYLTDLTTLSAYNHTSSLQNITSSWSGSLFNGDIVYPMAEYGQQISYTPEENNFGIDSEYGGLCVQDFKPAIRVKKVWDAIFTETGYTYSSSFWNQSWLDDTYMICNHKLRYPVYSNVDIETYGLFKIGPISGSNMTSVTMSAGVDLQLPWFNILSNPGNNMGSNLVWATTYATELRGTINLNFNISASVSSVPVFAFRIKDANTGTTISNQRLGIINDYLTAVQTYNNGPTKDQTIEISQQFNSGLLPSGSYKFYLEYENSGGGNVRTVLDPGDTIKSYLQISKASQIGDGLVMDIPSNMPYGTQGIKLVDFITGIQKKFNLVIYPNKSKPKEFIVETFNSWYKRGQVKDFNNYINLDKKIEVIPANNLAVNKLSFGDTLDQDYVSLQFSKAANREFAKSYYTDTTNYYSQGSLDVKTTFSASPLIRLAGTGISGSVGGINPPITEYFAGECKFGYSGDSRATCTSPIRYNVYTDTGRIQTGVIAYYDQYGDSPIIGLRWILDPSSYEIYDIDRFTGEIGYGSGDFC